MVSCTQICCALIVLIVGWIINALYQVGEFNLLYPFNVRHCRRIEGYHGCEDFAYFGNDDVYMSCDDRTWLKYHAPGQEYNLSTRIATQKQQGILYRLPHGQYDKAEEVQIRGYTRPDFHPLGIASLEDDTGKWLFVTDNRRDGETVEIFRVVSKNELDLFAEFRFDAPIFEPFQMLNDIIAIPNSGGSFYVTIWLVQEPGSFGNFIDVYLKRPVSYVLFCESPSKDFLNKKGTESGDKLVDGFKCRKVVEGLKMVKFSPD